MRKKITTLALLALFSHGFAQNYYVSPTGGGDCSQTNPCDLQTALLNAAGSVDNDVIILKAGTYYLSNLTYEPTIPSGSLTIKGEGDAILDAGKAGRVLKIDTSADNDENITISIENLTVKNGLIEGNNDKGGGLYIKTKWADVKIKNCKFIENSVTQDADGGGLFVFSGTGNITVENSVFYKNSSYDYSGGFDITTTEGVITVSHCVLKENTAGYGGGGSLETSIGRIDLINNLIVKNRSTASGNGRGGGVFINLNAGETYIINNTISDNSSSAYGGGMHVGAFDNNGDILIYNNIIYYNLADNNGGDLYIEVERGELVYTPTVSIENNDIQYMFIENVDGIQAVGKYRENSNLSVEPVFVDREEGDYHLSENSPLIDRGDNSPILPIPDKDIDGETRPYGNGIDMGADEVIYTQDTQTGDNDTGNNAISSGGGGGGCNLSPSTSPVNALLYLALPFVIFVRRLFRG